MRKWFRNERHENRVRRRNGKRSRLTLESLERRQLFDAGGFVFTTDGTPVNPMHPLIHAQEPERSLFVCWFS